MHNLCLLGFPQNKYLKNTSETSPRENATEIAYRRVIHLKTSDTKMII